MYLIQDFDFFACQWKNRIYLGASKYTDNSEIARRNAPLLLFVKMQVGFKITNCKSGYIICMLCQCVLANYYTKFSLLQYTSQKVLWFLFEGLCSAIKKLAQR